jgi:4-nitrophenyl phosphatase
MKKPVLLLDLDGVLVKDKALTPFPQTAELLRFLKDKGIPFKVLSNNSTKPPHMIVEELMSKGIPIEAGDFLSPLSVLGRFLRRNGIKRVLFLGSKHVEEFLKEEGFDVVFDYRVQAVVIAQDRSLSFEKLKLATSAVFLEGARLVPVNLSRLVKDDDGLYFPGAGSVALAIAHACNYKEELPNLGKPSREFINTAISGLDGEEVYLVSDDIYTDLMGARELGIKTVFMTTGKYKEEETERAGFKPDLIFHSLGGLLEYLNKTVLP